MRWPGLFLVIVLANSVAVAAPSEADTKRAHALLTQLARHHKTLKSFRGRYVQERETDLSPKPLRSSGEFLYSRRAACLLFEGVKPRPVRLRLDASSYQVYRPKARKAERFVFRGFSPGRMLLRVFTPEVAELNRTHAVVSCRDVGEETTIVLAPREKALKAHVASFTVRIRPKDFALLAVSYSRTGGEQVRITFQNLKRNITLDGRRFDRRVPEGTDLRITEVKK